LWNEQLLVYRCVLKKKNDLFTRVSKQFLLCLSNVIIIIIINVLGMQNTRKYTCIMYTHNVIVIILTTRSPEFYVTKYKGFHKKKPKLILIVTNNFYAFTRILYYMVTFNLHTKIKLRLTVCYEFILYTSTNRNNVLQSMSLLVGRHVFLNTKFKSYE